MTARGQRNALANDVIGQPERAIDARQATLMIPRNGCETGNLSRQLLDFEVLPIDHHQALLRQPTLGFKLGVQLRHDQRQRVNGRLCPLPYKSKRHHHCILPATTRTRHPHHTALAIFRNTRATPDKSRGFQ